MDPLSDTLSLLRPRAVMSAGLEAGGDWSIRFPAHRGIKFNSVSKGECWIAVPDEGALQKIETGDCFLLTRGSPFLLATDLDRPPIDAEPIYRAAKDGIAVCNGGGDFSLIGGRFAFEGDDDGQLFRTLPAIVHVSRAAAQSARQADLLRWTLEQLAIELKREAPGQALMVDRLAQIMLVQVLRLWIASERRSGWLGALGDERLGRALVAVHTSPERRWTIGDLARIAGMSRTVFAARFRDRVGVTVMGYLTDWRLRLAADRLRRGDKIAAIAASVGYESHAAFSTAFRRRFGCGPARYRVRDMVS